ncbi:putative type III secretion protein SctL [Neochlamydia sp. EPS4]|uniref:HrpE/YscL family type III secretion apparatus protein n=1 Tax=unclassified Neochlamydia TaxID=2643326 RepID=UPI0005838442|nr:MULTISPECIES: HrpE/YscL family type III secretion apparatus protein [unclassified Neochlamydia]KIC75664.1 putative type III secretion protein SctL [Neochlamydia sp. EPS4]BBI17931.1 Type III secretion ATPase inhibitor [Neochlamydia sp. S13]
MKKKFFSLIHGNGVHVAPETRVIPAEEFSQALEAYQLMEEVKKDALKYKQGVAEEIEKLKEQAQKEGFEEGFKKWVEQIAKVEEEIINVRHETEKVALPIALKAAKKIVGRELELSETAVVDIVSNSLKAVVTHKKITIYVNKKDLEALEKNRQQVKDLFESLETLIIRERADIESGGCIIETEGGIINAQLENQWRIIENAFDRMMKQHEKAAQGHG